MKKNLTFAASFLLVSCSTKINYEVSGDVYNDPDITVNHIYFNNWETGHLDSVAPINGKFTINGEVDHPTLFTTSQDGYMPTAFIAEQSGKITFEDGWPKGTPQNDSLLSFWREAHQKYPNGTFCRDVESFLKNNQNLAGAYTLFRSLVTGYLPDDTVKMIFSQQGEYVQNMVRKELSAMTEDAQMEAEAHASHVNMQYIDFEVEYNGKVSRLGDYIGKGRKLTVVDFWASWCGPCVAEIPYLKDVYAKYKGQGVEVVGVASNDKPENTEKAIAELGIIYPQMINAQSAGVNAYGIKYIPYIILIDADGTVLANDLRGDDIEAAVLEHLK